MKPFLFAFLFASILFLLAFQCNQKSDFQSNIEKLSQTSFFKREFQNVGAFKIHNEITSNATLSLDIIYKKNLLSSESQISLRFSNADNNNYVTLDYDEIEALIKAFNTFKNYYIKLELPKNYTEIKFVSRAGLILTMFMYDDGWFFSIKLRDQYDDIFFSYNELNDLINLVYDAKKAIESRK